LCLQKVNKYNVSFYNNNAIGYWESGAIHSSDFSVVLFKEKFIARFSKNVTKTVFWRWRSSIFNILFQDHI